MPDKQPRTHGTRMGPVWDGVQYFSATHRETWLSPPATASLGHQLVPDAHIQGACRGTGHFADRSSCTKCMLSPPLQCSHLWKGSTAARSSLKGEFRTGSDRGQSPGLNGCSAKTPNALSFSAPELQREHVKMNSDERSGVTPGPRRGHAFSWKDRHHSRWHLHPSRLWAGLRSV